MTTGGGATRRIGAIGQRIRDDYLGRDRMEEYRGLLRSAQDGGYRLVSLAEFREGIRDPDDERWLALRHDVDIVDVEGNHAFHRIERELGAHATFYFRRSTAPAHARLIAWLLEDGFEVGYHYEEAATYAKRSRAHDATDLERLRPAIEAAFRRNTDAFRRRWNAELRSAAGHGDWINRQLGIRNGDFVTPRVLADAGLDFEAYDDSILGPGSTYVSDVATPPALWASDLSLAAALSAGAPRIVLLTHERQWHTGRLANLRADTHRLFEAFEYRLPRVLPLSASR